jgi:Subtilase family
MISASDGQILRSNLKTTVSFPTDSQGTFIIASQTGGFVSTFSTWGPTNELHVDPHILAPGGNIYSTLPLALGGYSIESGTSMATPYAAGVIALYLSNKGKTAPLVIRSLIASTASPVDWNDGVTTTVGLKAPVVQQGGGLINAYRFVRSTTVIEPGFIELNVSLNQFT